MHSLGLAVLDLDGVFMTAVEKDSKRQMTQRWSIRSCECSWVSIFFAN